MTLTQTTIPNRIALRAGKKGALAPVFEKSATELKHKQNLFKYKSTIQIAKFNVKTLNRKGQLPKVRASAIDHNIDIVCVQEHIYHHSEEDIKFYGTGNGWVFVSASAWKNSVNAVIGVGMLIGPRVLKLLNSIEKIQPRLMVAPFNSNTSTTIISYNSSTYTRDETDLDAFYNELSSFVRSIPKHNLIIDGDMKAQIGKNVNNKFSLHDSTNRNGEHLTDFTQENGLKCLNTEFQKRKGKIWTYTYPNNAKA